MPSSTFPRFRAAVLIGVVFSALLMAGCSGETGPSADKVRLDLQDRVDSKLRGMIQLTDFTVSERKVLSEDRVRLRVSARNELDEDRVQAFREQERARSRLFGGGSLQPAKNAERVQGKTMHMITLYRRTGQDVWQLVNVQPAQR